MLEALDGPSLQGVITVTNTTPAIAIIGVTAYSERKVITLQSSKLDTPNVGNFYIYFADEGETPTSTDLSTKGFLQHKNSLRSYEASTTQVVWLMSTTVTSIKIRIAERG